MQTDRDHAVKVLNGLIERTLDSVNGYKEAAEHIENQGYRTLFAERASARMELTRRLQDEVRSFGGMPKDDQSLVGRAHNAFVGVKEAISPDSDRSVIDEVERGEDVLKGQFEKAVEDRDLPPQVQSLISGLYQSVKTDHDTISRIKHELH